MSDGEIGQFRSTLRKIERFLFKNLKFDGDCCNITFNECHILMEVSETGEITMSDLLSLLGLDKSVLTRTVDKMVRTGLLERREMEDDRRRKILSASPEGQDLALMVNNHMNAKFVRLFSSLDKEESNRVVESAQVIAGTFGKWDKEGD